MCVYYDVIKNVLLRMLATFTMAAYVTVCSTCLVLVVLGFNLATRNPSQPRMNVKASRIQIFTDNSSNSSKNLTRSSQRPIMQETYLADNSTSRNRWSEKRNPPPVASTPVPDKATPPEDSMSVGPSFRLDQIFKAESNDSL